MKVTVVDKAPPADERTGDIAKLFSDLVALMESEPAKKLRVEFDSKLEGLDAVKRIAGWAAEDGLLVYTTTIRNTTTREIHVERETPPVMERETE